MKNSMIIITLLIIAVLAAGCKRNSGVSGKKTGLTLQQFKDVKKGIIPFGPYDEGIKKITDTLGHPFKVEGNKSFWYAKDEKYCTEFYIEKMDNSVIGGDSIRSMGPETDMYKNCPAK